MRFDINHGQNSTSLASNSLKKILGCFYPRIWGQKGDDREEYTLFYSLSNREAKSQNYHKCLLVKGF